MLNDIFSVFQQNPKKGDFIYQKTRNKFDQNPSIIFITRSADIIVFCSKMQLNQKIVQLDESLCNYVSSNDPLRKSASLTVFMKKKQLSAFYSKMYSKTNQEIIMLEKENMNFDRDYNKLLTKEEERLKQKLHNRSFYIKSQSPNKILLNQKQNVNINLKPIISNQSNLNQAIRRRKLSFQQKNKNNQSFFAQSVQQNEKLMSRNNKSLSQDLIFGKEPMEKSKHRNSNLSVSNKEIKSAQKNFQLLELYQKLYGQFKSQKSIKTSKISNKSENKPQNNRPNTNKRLSKITIKKQDRLSIHKLSLKL